MKDDHQLDRGPIAEAGRARRILLVFLGLFVVLTGGDWFLRFYWFRWQELLWIKARPAVAQDHPAPVGAFTEKEISPREGGDLSHLIPIPKARLAFEETHPGALVTVDPEGFRTPAYDPASRFDVVVVGDSYMAEGLPMTNQFSMRLSSLLGTPVLNRAVQGRGPFQSVVRLLNERGTPERAPRWLIWGFIEREISGPAFERFVKQLYALEAENKGAAGHDSVVPTGIRWAALAPFSLRTSLPDSSALAQASRKAWNLIRYYGAGQLPSEVMVLKEPGQAPLLGYGEALTSMYWSPEVRNIPQAVQSVVYIRDFLAERNMQLVVVPIPDKEQIYRDLIPRSAWRGGRPPYPSCLPEFTAGLQSNGVHVIDLSTVFASARARGEQLYWRDDTHWNENGIRLATEEIARTLKVLRTP